MSAEKRNKFRPKNNPENEIEELDNNAIEDYEPVAEKKKAEGTKNKPKSTPKATTEKEKPESVKASKDKVPFTQRVEQFKLFYFNERTQKITGLILILFSAYLAIAFVSYFFSWQIDQDKVLGNSHDLFSPETKVKNWLGKAGALVSHWFMYKGFGAASFILVPVFFMYGLQKVVQKKLINIGSFNAKWLFLIVWSSLVLSFVFSEIIF